MKCNNVGIGGALMPLKETWNNPDGHAILSE